MPIAATPATTNPPTNPNTAGINHPPPFDVSTPASPAGSAASTFVTTGTAGITGAGGGNGGNAANPLVINSAALASRA